MGRNDGGKGMRTYIIIVSRTFPCSHSRSGEDTGFPQKLRNGLKLHTIRTNATWWEMVAKEVNAGEAVLSVRTWEGRPYCSKQVEIMQVTKLGLQSISMSSDTMFPLPTPCVDGRKQVDIYTLARNDGLSLPDFLEWFFPCGDGFFRGVIVHFTDFRY